MPEQEPAAVESAVDALMSPALPDAPALTPQTGPVSSPAAQGEVEPPNATPGPIQVTDAMLEQLQAFNAELAALLGKYGYSLVGTPYIEEGLIKGKAQVALNVPQPMPAGVVMDSLPPATA